MTSPPPGPPQIRHIDFSEFHPLDHSLRACRGYPGGQRRHLAHRWRYQWRDRLRELTLCKLGWHERARWWNHRGESGLHCRNCLKDIEVC